MNQIVRTTTFNTNTNPVVVRVTTCVTLLTHREIHLVANLNDVWKISSAFVHMLLRIHRSARHGWSAVNHPYRYIVHFHHDIDIPSMDHLLSTNLL